jgi:hypothetical protein
VTWQTPSATDLQAGTTTTRAEATEDRDGTPPRSRAEARRAPAKTPWAKLLVPPAGAFLLAQVALIVAAVIDGRLPWYFSPNHWGRFDSGLYLQIADHGYTIRNCHGPVYPPHSLCGTVGWSPAYPWLMAALGHLGLSLPAAGMVLSWLFAFLALAALWLLIGPEWTFSKLCSLALAACFPGMVYYFALFPVSLLVFLTVVSLLLFIRRHYLLAGLVGALCPWVFATGALVAATLLVAALLVERGPRLWRAVVESAGVAFGGFVLFLVANRLWSGSWTAYFSTQAKYGNALHDPVATFVQAFIGAPLARYALQDPNPGYNFVIPKAQTAFVAFLVLTLVAWTLWHRPVGRLQWVILTYTVIVWLVPLVSGPSLSRYRIELLLVPCVALCTRLPRPLQVALVGTSLVLAVGLAMMFTRAQIV